MSNSRPISGAASTSGAPVMVQCAAAFARRSRTAEWPDSSICSSEPSAWSPAYRLVTDSIEASSALTHTTPAAIWRSVCGSGPTPSGNRLTATTKNTTGSSASTRRRNASRRSRA